MSALTSLTSSPVNSPVPSPIAAVDFEAVAQAAADQVLNVGLDALANVEPRRELSCVRDKSGNYIIVRNGTTTPYHFLLVGRILPAPATKLSAIGNVYTLNDVSQRSSFLLIC